MYIGCMVGKVHLGNMPHHAKFNGVAEIWRFNSFHNGSRLLSWILKDWKF